MTAMIETREGYAPQKPDTLAAYLSRIEHVCARNLAASPTSWTIAEVGDGNLNLVFIVKGPKGGVAVKQALPYVRLVGESWPLPLSRAHYEHMALSEQSRLTGRLVPQILHYDETQALIVMELLEPHIIMRRGMIAGTVYPKFADDISTFMARTLYFTSDLALTADKKKAMIAAFAGNTALCKITEDLIFTDPYRVAELNRWTSPQLDAYAARWREDGDLKVAVSRLKLKFLSSAEAMLHGDLHTGSVMLTPEDTRIIDPEFAFMGPMGFDVGAVVANFLLNYFSQDGHEKTPGDRDAYRDWVLATVEADLDLVPREVPRPVAREPHGRCLSAVAVRGSGRRGAPRGGAAGLHGPALGRHGGLRRRQDDPPHPRPCPQHRPRMDRGQGPPRHLRSPRPDAGAGHDGEHRKLPLRSSAVTDAARRVRQEIKRY